MTCNLITTSGGDEEIVVVGGNGGGTTVEIFSVPNRVWRAGYIFKLFSNVYLYPLTWEENLLFFCMIDFNFQLI